MFETTSEGNAIPGRTKITTGTPQPTTAKIIDIVKRSLDDDKAREVVVIDLAGKTTLADYMVVASGGSIRHVAAMSEHLRERLKAGGVKSVPVEGLEHCDWVLIDAGDVIIHIFRPEVRDFYNIEKMWGAHRPRGESAGGRLAG